MFIVMKQLFYSGLYAYDPYFQERYIIEYAVSESMAKELMAKIIADNIQAYLLDNSVKLLDQSIEILDKIDQFKLS
jgi:hypothetical protein